MLCVEKPTLDFLQQLEARLLPRLQTYGDVLRSAAGKSYDSYASFQPFNESTRALFPLFDEIKKYLKPGDVILDTWCRTGFSGALLAGLFPEQQVISMWEGNLGVLGYEGYAYWLSKENRLSNWDIIFADPSRGLPFKDKSFAFIHALDSLHRYTLQPFLSDCLRTVSDSGTIIFPHIHLSNSQPDPFFERGGLQLHGESYKAYFAKVLQKDHRIAYVMSEKALFNLEQPTALIDQANTPHYNGLVAIFNQSPAEIVVKPWSNALIENERPIRQSLVQVDKTNGTISINNERAFELLRRHPCYAERLEQVLPHQLTSLQIKIWTWAETGATWQDIADRLKMDLDQLKSEADALYKSELLITLPIGEQMGQLQAFYADRFIMPRLNDQCFAHLWSRLENHYRDREVLRSDDGSVFYFGDVKDIVCAMARLFQSLGLSKGQHVLMQSQCHAEAVLAVWAVWLCGAVIAPVDPLMPRGDVEQLIDRLQPTLFLDAMKDELGVPAMRCLPRLTETSSFFIGDRLSEWIGNGSEAFPDDEFNEIGAENKAAAVIFTSGSTGKPKAVVLSHGALFRGSWALTSTYGIQKSDVLCCPGGLHTMSGLRNTCLLPFLSGATLATVDSAQFSHPSTAAAACRQHGISVLSVVPAFLNLVAAVRSPLAFGPLRQILCTGNVLRLEIQKAAETKLGVPVYSYYGLTETGGVCLAIKPEMERTCDADIGVPVNAHLRLVDDNGDVIDGPKTIGHLEIYSNQLMLEYFDDTEASAKKFHDGWLRTGDLARIENGHCILIGRTDDMFKTRHGVAVYPAVIEEVLCAHEDVSEAAVIGEMTLTGPRLHAWIITKSLQTEDWLTQFKPWLSARLNIHFCPDEFHLVESLPRVANGKIAKVALRKELMEIKE